MITLELNEIVVVGLGEIQISDNPDLTLTCYGIGSCIAMTAYDPVAMIWGNGALRPAGE